MKNLKQTNGKTTETKVYFYKGKEIVLSIYLERHYIDEQFDFGTLTIRYDNNNINFGECVYHNEDALLKVHDRMMDMVKKEFDYDEIYTHNDVCTRIVKVKE